MYTSDTLGPTCSVCIEALSPYLQKCHHHLSRLQPGPTRHILLLPPPFLVCAPAVWRSSCAGSVEKLVRRRAPSGGAARDGAAIFASPCAVSPRPRHRKGTKLVHRSPPPPRARVRAREPPPCSGVGTGAAAAASSCARPGRCAGPRPAADMSSCACARPRRRRARALARVPPSPLSCGEWRRCGRRPSQRCDKVGEGGGEEG